MPTDERPQSEPHWLVEHAAKVVVGFVILAILGWAATNYEDIWTNVRCQLSDNPLEDRC